MQRANTALVWLAAILWAAVFVKQGVVETLGQDAHAYWLALQGGSHYEKGPAELDAYLYSPVFAQVLSPLGLLPWWTFFALWVFLGVCALLWLVKPLGRVWGVPVALFCVPDLVIGNIYVFLALMVAVGVRWPVVWAFGALTKVTPGLGILWILARRDWRGLALAVVPTAALTLISFAIAPSDWRAWIELLLSSPSGDPTFFVRCAVAAVLAVLAVRRDRTWILAVAVVVATPVLNAAACFVPLAAIPRIREWSRTTPSTAGPIRRTVAVRTPD